MQLSACQIFCNKTAKSGDLRNINFNRLYDEVARENFFQHCMVSQKNIVINQNVKEYTIPRLTLSFLTSLM